MVMRAYYGMKSDIRNYVNLVVLPPGKKVDYTWLYWDDYSDWMDESPEMRELHVLNVTTPVRFSIDPDMNDGKGGVKISSG